MSIEFNFDSYQENGYDFTKNGTIENGMLKGKVTSVIFKGIHYQILVQCGRYEIEIQSTSAPKVGELVGLNIGKDGIHVMKKKFRVNKFSGVITKRNTVEFGDGEFECDVTQLYPGSHLDEEGYLITAKGEKIEVNPKDPRYLKVVWGVGYKVEKI